VSQINEMPKRGLNIIVNRIPRPTPLVDLPPNFPPLGNLKLDLMENKLKLKKGAPSAPRKTSARKSRARVTAPSHTSAIDPRVLGQSVAAQMPSHHNGLNQSLGTDTSVRPKPLPSPPISTDPIVTPTPSAVIDPHPATYPAPAPVQQPSPVSPVTVIVGQMPPAQLPQPTPEPPPLVPDLPDPEENAPPPEPEMSPEEREARDVDEYLWRFRVLKKKYPKAVLPEFTKHSDPIEMKVAYERSLKELTMDDCINSYQGYILMSFVGMEGFAKWMSIDIGGFAKSEREALERHREYDKFLIEMGEKSYSSWGVNIPVEIRLVLFVVFKMITFFVVKHMLGGMFEMPHGKRKRRMRGPSISVEEIREERKNSDGEREAHHNRREEKATTSQRRPSRIDEQD
jgi:hypothetical protein